MLEAQLISHILALPIPRTHWLSMSMWQEVDKCITVSIILPSLFSLDAPTNIDLVLEEAYLVPLCI